MNSSHARTKPARCFQCGGLESSLIHHATANGHPFCATVEEFEAWIADHYPALGRS